MKDFGNRVTRTRALGVSPRCAKTQSLTVRKSARAGSDARVKCVDHKINNIFAAGDFVGGYRG